MTDSKKEEYPLQIRKDSTGIILQKRSKKGNLNVIFLTPKEVEKLKKEIC